MSATKNADFDRPDKKLCPARINFSTMGATVGTRRTPLDKNEAATGEFGNDLVSKRQTEVLAVRWTSRTRPDISNFSKLGELDGQTATLEGADSVRHPRRQRIKTMVEKMKIAPRRFRGTFSVASAHARATAGGAIVGREPVMVTGVGDPRRRIVPLAGRRGCRTRVALRQRKRPAPVTLAGSISSRRALISAAASVRQHVGFNSRVHDANCGRRCAGSALFRLAFLSFPWFFGGGSALRHRLNGGMYGVA